MGVFQQKLPVIQKTGNPRNLPVEPPQELLAVVITGELVDYCETKTYGVRFILDAVEQACRTRICVYLTDRSGRYVDGFLPQLASEVPVTRCVNFRDESYSETRLYKTNELLF